MLYNVLKLFQKPRHESRRRFPSFDSWLVDLASKLTAGDEDQDETKTDLETHQEEVKPDAENQAEEEEWDNLFEALGKKRQKEDIVDPNPAKTMEKIQLQDDNRRDSEEPVHENGERDVDKILEELGKKRKEEYSSMDRRILGDRDIHEFVGPVWEPGKPKATTIGHYIVLESNLVTCGAGLDIRKVVPGYDLCQISFYLPLDTEDEEIEGILLKQGFSGSDFRIHKIEKKGGAVQVTVITDSRLGKKLAEQEEKRSPWQRLSFEVRHDAVWTLGYMQGSQPMLTLTWSINATSGTHDPLSVELGSIYERLSDSEGARMETCCVLTPETGSAANQVTLMVEFDTWENAQLAAREIEAKRPKIQSFKCTLPTIYEHSITIPLEQYEAQMGQWLGISDTKSEQAVSIHTTVSRNMVIVGIQGEGRTSVGALKVRIERLARGDVLEGPYWHPSFASSEDSEVFLRKVTDAAKVYLKCDPDFRNLRVYGKPERVGHAQKMIREEVTRREQIMTRTALADSSANFFVREGFGRLQELVGEENVDLKITSKWSAIMMRGGEEATHHLRRLLEKSVEPLANGIKANLICPVCLSEALYMEVLGCGHGYCSGCFNGFLKAAAENKTFPLVCIGKEGKCQVPIALPLIHSFLPHYDFNRLVEVAFASYLEKHPTELRYCRTPDCRQTYRRQTSRPVDLVCPSCFARTCSSCGEDHKNMTCEEYRIYRDPEEQERLNNQLAVKSGFKRCPRCAVWVEKISGCNHMSCKCGAHICWVCLGVFPPHAIYDHIRQAH